jgi:hypothetical protein
MDDTVLWTEIAPDDSADAKRDKLLSSVADFDGAFAEVLSQQGESLVVRRMAFFVNQQVVAPMKLTAQQQWFGWGLMGTLAAKYGSEILGSPRANMLADESAELPNRMSPRGIDLTALPDPKDIKPIYLSAYVDAMSRKATGVIGGIVTKQGDGIIPKLLSAIKANPPADNAALIKIISDTTGTDPTESLQQG